MGGVVEKLEEVWKGWDLDQVDWDWGVGVFILFHFILSYFMSFYFTYSVLF